MSSKFFTWTKGDRKHAAEVLRSGGIVPIPVECISIKGFDARRTPKLGTISHRSSAGSDMKSSPTGIALHDAAVESATSLMAVVNDLLKSPHISAHLSQRGGPLQIPYGRPRSRTAPSTPLQQAVEFQPVELPGSFPDPHERHISAFALPRDPTPPSIAGDLIERTHTSPHLMTDRFATHSRASIDSERTPALQEPWTASQNSAAMARNSSSQGSRSSRAISFTTAATKPPLTMPKSGLSYDMHSETTSQDHHATRHDSVQQDDVEATLLQQIACMRTSHDAHIKSLKHAHDTEVGSHLSYIAFLERRQLDRGLTQQPLTIDTTHLSQMPSELPALDVSATTSQSFESSFDTNKSISQETVAEVESLRRKLSLVRKEQAESADLNRQREQMRESLEQRDRRILQLKELTRRAKENERTLRNTITDLEARLVAANNQRLDVLEGFHVACSTLEAVSSRRSPQDLVRAISRTVPAPEVSAATFKSSHPRSIRASHDGARPRTTKVWDTDPLVAQVRSLQTLLKQKDERVSSLERDLRNKISTETHNAARFEELQGCLDKGRRALTKVEDDRDRLHSLLQSELRKQARQTVRMFPASPSVAAEASDQMRSILDRAKATALEPESGLAPGEELKSIPGVLQKELEHCLSEIIMYKLDVRGYRKDLKETRAQLESLQASIAPKPLTPPRSASRNRSTYSREQRKSSVSGGLGIMLAYPPVTPPRPDGAAGADALLAVSPDTRSTISTPLHRPKTPLAAHKKLPKPPSPGTNVLNGGRSPPTVRILRAETMRSMSDSIISSYAQRTTPELLDGDVMSERAGRAGQARSTGNTPLMRTEQSRRVQTV